MIDSFSGRTDGCAILAIGRPATGTITRLVDTGTTINDDPVVEFVVRVVPEAGFEGWARPAGNLDRFLQAIFEITNASPNGRPSLFFFAHLAHRHRRSQRNIGPLAAVQMVLFRAIVAVGTLLGR